MNKKKTHNKDEQSSYSDGESSDESCSKEDSSDSSDDSTDSENENERLEQDIISDFCPKLHLSTIISYILTVCQEHKPSRRLRRKTHATVNATAAAAATKTGPGWEDTQLYDPDSEVGLVAYTLWFSHHGAQQLCIYQVK